MEHIKASPVKSIDDVIRLAWDGMVLSLSFRSVGVGTTAFLVRVYSHSGRESCKTSHPLDSVPLFGLPEFGTGYAPIHLVN